MKYKAKMTHEQRRERRRQIAEWVVAEGQDTTAVKRAAVHFGVGLATVKEAIQTHGLTTRKVTAGVSVYKVIAALLRGESHCAIAESLGMNRGGVYQTYQCCVAAGIPVPKVDSRRGPKPKVNK